VSQSPPSSDIVCWKRWDKGSCSWLVYSMCTLYASDRHLPSVWISASVILTCAAHVTAPLWKLWVFHFALLRPAVQARYCRCWTTYSRVNACCSYFLIQRSGASSGLIVSLAQSCLMTCTGHPSSSVAVVVTIITLRNGSFLILGE